MMLFICAGLTVLIETPWMWLWGLRHRDELLLVICVNVVTNLMLNTVLSLCFPYGVGGLIYFFESVVVAVEFGVYSLALKPSLKLFLITLAANCLSYGIGLLIF